MCSLFPKAILTFICRSRTGWKRIFFYWLTEGGSSVTVFTILVFFFFFHSRHLFRYFSFLISSGLYNFLSIFTYTPIRKTCLYNFDPLKPHYIVKLGFTWVQIFFFFLFLLKNILWVLRGGSNEYPQSTFWAGIWNYQSLFFLIWKLSVFGGEIFYIFE